MKKYFRVWKQLATLSLGSYASNRIEYGSYFLGKVIRFGFFWLMVSAFFRHTDFLAGYSKYQALTLLVTGFLVDSLTQAFFRGVYLFREDIRKGNADYIFSKPINPLFYVMSRLTDVLDIIFTLLLIIWAVYLYNKLFLLVTLSGLLLYFAFVIFGVFVIAALHIISASLTVFTMESESVIWLYRNAMFLSPFPPEIFASPVKFIFTFMIPIFIVASVPVKALFGTLTPAMAATAIFVTIVFFFGSLLLWKASLRHYSSASS